MCLRLSGWKIVGSLTTEKKCVLIFAYHTSNWDFPICLAVKLALKVKVCFVAKASLFRWPLGLFFHYVGGIPVERSSTKNLVAQVVERFQAADTFILALAPEGTRKKVDRWKTGFYHIALQAKVPIQPIAFDYRVRTFTFGPLLYPSGDYHKDAEILKAFYLPHEPRHPHLADKNFLTDLGE